VEQRIAHQAMQTVKHERETSLLKDVRTKKQANISTLANLQLWDSSSQPTSKHAVGEHYFSFVIHNEQGRRQLGHPPELQAKVLCSYRGHSAALFVLYPHGRTQQDEIFVQLPFVHRAK
jgi:hypothetical protein